MAFSDFLPIALGLQVLKATPVFDVAAGGLSSGLHACRVKCSYPLSPHMSLFLDTEHGLTVNFGLSSNRDIHYIQDGKPETLLGFSKPPSPPLYTQVPLHE